MGLKRLAEKKNSVTVIRSSFAVRGDLFFCLIKACRGIHLVLSRSGREGVELVNCPCNIKIGGHDGGERAERVN